MKKEVKLYKTTSVSFATEPDAVFFVKGVNETVVRTYITTSDGQAIPLKDLSGGGSGSGIQFITSTDSSIDVTGTATSKNIEISSALQTLINSALQSGDAVSSLLNDAGYITLADVPTFNPSDYDLSDFTNTSPDPFVKQSELTSGATNLGYTASPTNGIVTSDTGLDATIPLADSTNAGLLSPAEKSEIATAIQPSDLGAVATSNDYNDLDNKPTIPLPLTNHSELNLDDGTNPHGTTKADVGLDNVDNTSDINKPISTATQNALNGKQNTLGFTPENVANKNNTTLNNSSTEYPTSGLVLKEREAIVVSSSQTAVLNRVHNVVATATLTDPTPVEGNGYYVNVINSIATVGGVAYSVGTQLFRHFHSGSWRTFVYQNDLFQFNTKEGFLFHEDFIGNPGGSSFAAGYGLIPSISGAGATCIPITTYPNRTNQQGVLQLGTGTTATGSSNIRLGDNNAGSIYIGNGEIIMQCFYNVQTLSTITERFYEIIGFMTSGNFANTNTISFVYDEGGVGNYGSASANWKCVTRVSPTTTTTITTVPVVAGKWYVLKIVINSLGNSINFFIDNVLVATHTTNIPTLITPRVAKVKTSPSQWRNKHSLNIRHLSTISLPGTEKKQSKAICSFM